MASKGLPQLSCPFTSCPWPHSVISCSLNPLQQFVEWINQFWGIPKVSPCSEFTPGLDCLEEGPQIILWKPEHKAFVNLAPAPYPQTIQEVPAGHHDLPLIKPERATVQGGKRRLQVSYLSLAFLPLHTASHLCHFEGQLVQYWQLYKYILQLNTQHSLWSILYI